MNSSGSSAKPSSILPASSRVALKEWASVLTAMDRGEQIVLLRKGGLVEPGSAFELLSSSFVFYPTYEHQTIDYLRPEFRRYMEDARVQRAPDGTLRIGWAALVTATTRSQDPSILERLSRFHVYNQDFLTQRIKWQPDQPIAIITVRVFRLPVPQELPLAPHYAGCRSWVDLDRAVDLSQADPVLSDHEFEARVEQLSELLAS